MAPPTFAEDPKAALAAYAESGVHVEPRVFEAELCEELISVANEFPAVKRGDFRTALQPHRQSSAFLRALRHSRVTAIVRRLLDGAISGIQTQFFYGKPGTPGFQPHQDNSYVNAPRGKFTSVWVALSDVSRENGCLYAFPGSFREALLGVKEVEAKETMLQDVNALKYRCVVPEKYQSVDLEMKKGSAAFFDGYTVHGSHTNKSQRSRCALLMTYITRGAQFNAGRYAQREEVAID
jgi:phytanoyl-CoA hydroxylase